MIVNCRSFWKILKCVQHTFTTQGGAGRADAPADSAPLVLLTQEPPGPSYLATSSQVDGLNQSFCMRTAARTALSLLLLSAAFPARAFSPGVLPLRGMSAGSPATSPRGGARLASGPGHSQLLPARGGRTGGKYGSLRMQQQVDEKAEASEPLLVADEEKPADKGVAEAVTPAAWGVLALLLAVNVHSQWSRALVYYLVSFKVCSCTLQLLF